MSKIELLGETFDSYTAAVKSVDKGELEAWLDFFDVEQVMLSKLPDLPEDKNRVGFGWLTEAADGVLSGLEGLSLSSVTYQAWHSLVRYIVHGKPLPAVALAYFAQNGQHALEALADRRWYSAARYIVFGGDEREVAFAIADYLDGGVQP